MPALKYVGKDRTTDWLPGVPARDLSASEAKRWPEAEASAFYRVIKEAPKAAKTEPAGHGEEKQEN